MWDDYDGPNGTYDDGPSGAFGSGEHDEMSLGRQVPEELRRILELQRQEVKRNRWHLGRTWPRPPTVLDDLRPNEGTPGRRRIVLPPGTRLSRSLHFVLTPAWYALRIAPTIADTQEEYYQELKAGRVGHARLIAFRGYILVAKVLVKGLLDAIKALLLLGP